MNFEIVGDSTPEDWVKFFGCTREEYTREITEAQARLNTQQESVGRNDIIRDYFNSIATTGDGRHTPSAVRRFYESDKFSKLLAFEIPESGILHAMHGAITGGMANMPGEPLEVSIKMAQERFGPHLKVLDHGFGNGQTALGIGQHAPGSLIVLADFYCPTRAFLFELMQKYVKGVHLVVQWITGPYQSRYDELCQYDLVNSNEVMEHVPWPETEINRIASCTRMGGYLQLGTFFNSCDGYDPQHLTENDLYQDTNRWFSVVQRAGFQLAARDPRGVEKVFERV